MTWTIQQAQRAGLLNNPTWKAHPEAMLRARCVSSICRAVYPDLAMGLYEESEGEEIRGGGEVIDAQSTVRAVTRPVVITETTPALPAPQSEALNPAFAPTTEEITARILGLINKAASVQGLGDVAIEIKALPEAQRQPFNEPYKRRRTELQIAEILTEAAKPGADKQALTAKAHSLKGVTEAQEKQLAEALR